MDAEVIEVLVNYTPRNREQNENGRVWWISDNQRKGLPEDIATKWESQMFCSWQESTSGERVTAENDRRKYWGGREQDDKGDKMENPQAVFEPEMGRKVIKQHQKSASIGDLRGSSSGSSASSQSLVYSIKSLEYNDYV